MAAAADWAWASSPDLQALRRQGATMGASCCWYSVVHWQAVSSWPHDFT